MTTSTHLIPGILARVVALGGQARVEVDDTTVRVRCGPVFSADIPRASIRGATVGRPRLLDGIGVHGWRGRWVVNGRLGDAVVVRLDPPGRARVAAVPFPLRTLLVTVDDPAALAAELSS